VKNMENINIENTTENITENTEEKKYDILYPISLHEIFENEEFQFEFCFFREISEISEILEILPEIIGDQEKEISIINMEDKIVIVIFTNTTEIYKYLNLKFSIGKLFYDLKDQQYSKITSKYIQKDPIYVKSYFVKIY